MPVVETIYTPTAKDQISGLRQTRFFGLFAQASAAATLVLSGSSFTVPPDTCRFLTGWSAIGTGGAGQSCDQFQLVVLFSGTTSIAACMSPYQRINALGVAYTGPLDLMCLPGEVIQLQGIYSAGGVANFISGFVWGYDVPRANISA